MKRKPAKKRINSRAKGAQGEREAAKALTLYLGLDARRGQQFSGVEGEDVVTSLSGVHFEVKRTEVLHLYKAMAQSTRDASGAIPVVLHRRNGEDWVAIVPLSRLLELSSLIVAHDDPMRNPMSP